MTNQINFKTELSGDFDGLIDRVTSALKGEGFGILTRIDMHTKIEEKIGKKLPKVVILGACNPTMAYEAYTANSDVASLLPCNVVVRDIGAGKVSIEIIKPTICAGNSAKTCMNTRGAYRPILHQNQRNPKQQVNSPPGCTENRQPYCHMQAAYGNTQRGYFRSKRSAFITLVQAATKSLTNFSRLSSCA